MDLQTPTTAGIDGGRATMIVARNKYDMGIRYFMAMLTLLVMSEIAFHVRSWLVGVILLPSLITLVALLTNEKIEFDFVRKRYRVYRFTWLVGRNDYKDLPALDHILLRDVTLTGSVIRSLPIGDTYGFELALVDQAHERMIVCIRYSDKSVRTIAKAMLHASGLRLEDATEEQLLGDMAEGPAPSTVMADPHGMNGMKNGTPLP